MGLSHNVSLTHASAYQSNTVPDAPQATLAFGSRFRKLARAMFFSATPDLCSRHV
jgi:hypothetical protein